MLDLGCLRRSLWRGLWLPLLSCLWGSAFGGLLLGCLWGSVLGGRRFLPLCRLFLYSRGGATGRRSCGSSGRGFRSTSESSPPKSGVSSPGAGPVKIGGLGAALTSSEDSELGLFGPPWSSAGLSAGGVFGSGMRERERERERGREREGERERGREQDKPSHVRGHIARYSSSSSGVTGEGTVNLTWLFAWFRFRDYELKFHRSRRLRLEPSEPAVDRGGVILCRLFTYCLGL